jgi:hypothetical protein
VAGAPWVIQARLGGGSKTDVALRSLQIIAILYQVGFALCLPATKYAGLSQVQANRWFVACISLFYSPSSSLLGAYRVGLTALRRKQSFV